MESTAHRVALLQSLAPGELLIHEIYRSLQGESAYAGLPCVFVRTTQCDYRCSWCDTPHAFNQGSRMTRAAVLEAALSYDTPLIEITGGEPLLQSEVLPLMAELCDAGKTVLLETHGGLDIGPVDRRVHIIMDLKCPDSGECDRNDFGNLAKLKPSDEIKFVVASRRDWEWAEATIREHDLCGQFFSRNAARDDSPGQRPGSRVTHDGSPERARDSAALSGLEAIGSPNPGLSSDAALRLNTEAHPSGRFNVLVSGVFGDLKAADLAAWILASGLNVRFQLQLHKYVWDPKARGV